MVRVRWGDRLPPFASGGRASRVLLVAILAAVPAGFAPVNEMADPTGPAGLGPSVPSVSPNPVTSFPPSSTGGSIPVGTDPVSPIADPENGFVYVPNYGSSTLTVVSGVLPIATIPVGSEPSFALWDPSNGFVYVLNTGSANVSVIDGTSVVATISVGTDPAQAVFDPADREVYVTNAGSSFVSLLNNTTETATVPVGPYATWLTYDPSTMEVVVANELSGNLTFLRGGAVVGSVSGIGPTPSALVFDPSTGWIDVASDPSNGNGSVRAVNGSRIQGADLVPPGPTGLVVDSALGEVYVLGSSGNVSVLEGLRTTATIRGFTSPAETGTIDPMNGDLYAAEPMGRSVAVVSGSQIVGTVPVGSDPDGLAYDPVNGLVYVANGMSANLTMIAARAIQYPVRFHEIGLPNGTAWSVSLNGSVLSSTTDTASASRADGSYQYEVATVNGYNVTPATGTIQVNGSAVDTSLVFSTGPGSVGRYTVTFAELGLPKGTNWSILLDHARLSGSGELVDSAILNGSHPFSVGAVGSYLPSPREGNVTVQGRSVNTTITFTASSPTPTNFTSRPPAPNGLPLLWVVSALLVVIAAVTATIWARARGRRR